MAKSRFLGSYIKNNRFKQRLSRRGQQIDKFLDPAGGHRLAAKFRGQFLKIAKSGIGFLETRKAAIDRLILIAHAFFKKNQIRQVKGSCPELSRHTRLIYAATKLSYIKP